MNNVENIINSGYTGGITITGGGTGAISKLLENGGGSKFLEYAYIPYSEKSIRASHFIQESFKYVSPEIVEAFAKDSLNFADIGVAASCKLHYEGEREGRSHEGYVACTKESDDKYITRIYKFKSKYYYRQIQEDEFSDFILEKMSEFIDELKELE